ncbi:MAG: NADP-dependent phosphogluconate dehydrogenase [Firmicutes bacterium]|nr:NADP-dependent phosphogluconate dehydrogenase [Bacillota bacterium]
MDKRAELGLVGLGVMGQNLALNIAANGFKVAVYNRSSQVTKEFIEGKAKGKKIVGAITWQELAEALQPPRRVLLMVKAGTPVDSVIGELLNVLRPGDVIIDGGNSRFQDTVRRQQLVQAKGLLYLGMGISGGEEGALRGASMMPGGDEEAWHISRDPLLAAAAKASDGKPCCTYLGPGGVGHFVKTVHNGIEYGDMQLISEAYFLMRTLLGMEPKDIGQIFAQWNQGELESYLIEITADILSRDDEISGKPLVDVILDKAGQKGTGMWTAQEAMELGVPAPTIAEAVFARALSGLKSEREKAAQILEGPAVLFGKDQAAFVEDIRKALYLSKICSYAQGFAILRQASSDYRWNLDLGGVALIWRAGCIIRAGFLNDIANAFQRNSDLNNLLVDPYFAETLKTNQRSLRTVVAEAALAGIPVPGFGSALFYYDGYRKERLPAYLLQAQRDYFGAHTYERVDRTGAFHTEWGK